ncbi:hypothetical protein [Heyndrickxia faecalis]|uniref:hypothetical protein n=1 Tax=Heyndrickxia faecalis TaxID=2824910 RepID=UPI003D23830F
MENDRKQGNHLSRSLRNRHIQFLALGGVIGVGLFYGASQAVKMAGRAFWRRILRPAWLSPLSCGRSGK